MPGNMFTPRPYQIELVERALKRNTIACLNSSSAKLFVWMTYLKEILGHNFKVTHGDEKETNAFVLLNSDHLVREYGMLLQTHLDMTVISITSEKGSQLQAADWQSTLSQNMIVATTSKVLASALRDSFFDCSVISVLILDECHNVIKEESDYRAIVEILDQAGCTPYVLGVTCSLLKEDSTAAKLENDIRLMESLLNCKAETATDLIALDGCSPSQPDEKIVLCGSKKGVDDDENCELTPNELMNQLRDILIPAIKWLENCNITPETGITVSRKGYSDSDDDDIENDTIHQHDDTPIGEISTAADSGSTSNEDDGKISDSSNQANIDIQGLVKTSRTVLSQVLLVLDVLGLWCAHRLVILLLKQLQKSFRVQDSFTKCGDTASKWQYLLLRYTDSHLRTVYTLCQTHLGNQKKVDLRLVTPKVDRLLQVLKEYKPPADTEKKEEKLKSNDRSEANSKSWWQDSDAEDDEEEEQMMNKVEKDGDSNANSIRARQYHHANTLCGIVFVKEKYVALMLQRLLKEISKEDSDLWHISSAHITSLATTEPVSTILEREEVSQDMYNNPTNTEKLKQEEVLRSFRSHEVNLLVSTNCLEEYAEIPKCNLVLRFDVPITYRSYVLSKSRVRSTNSTYMMLVHEAEKSQFMLRLKEYKKIEKVLQDSTYESLLSRPADIDFFDVDDDDVDGECEVKAPPYYSGPNTCATMDSAIHIINRYCSRLPSDPFTHLSARCDIIEVPNSEVDLDDPMYNASINKLYEGVLQLPINAHVTKPIKGFAMSTALLAQKAVALEACKVLHKAKELDDHFMPIGKEMVKYAEELDSWPEEKSKVPGRPGTTKRRQTYEKEIPSALSGCLPRSNIPLFLYEIEMKLKTRLPDGLNVRRRKLHAPEETTRCFGILTAKPLPTTLVLPIYTRSGEESVRIKLCRSFISLGEHHIKMVRSFHHYIFSDMLRIDRVPLTFRPDSSKMQIFVVILDKPDSSSDLDIDWKFICKVATQRRIDDRMRNDPWFRHRILEKKGGKNVFVFERSKYEDGVVIAKYRSPDQPNRFYVAEIKDELDPYSQFPSSEYESFHHYYRIKYGLDISCLNQPLLDVDHTSSRLNLLTPRYMNQKGKILPVSSLEKKRAKYETLTNRQILVPELCDLHPVPASLWRKAVCIPSILYRLSSILVAEELRCKIYEESGIGQRELPVGQTWPDLDFGWENDDLSDIDGDDMLQIDDEITTPSANEDIGSREKGTASLDMAESGEKTNDEPSDHNLKSGEKENCVSDSKDGNVAYNANREISKAENQGKIENRNDLTNGIDVKDNDESSSVPNNTVAGQESLVQNCTEDNVTSVSTVSENSAEEGDAEITFNGELSSVKSVNESAQVPNHDTSASEILTKDGNSENMHDDRYEYDSDDFHSHFNLSDDADKSVKQKSRKHRNESNHAFSMASVPQEIFQTLSGEMESIGPSPGLILQALTLSNASDGFNLERLEMLGDSFLKHAVTVYLFCTYPHAHEGKLSYMRSKKVSNYNLYRIGQKKNLPGKMTALIFDPAVNWLPPGYIVGGRKTSTDDSIDDVYKDSQCDDLDDEMEIGVWTGVPGQKALPPKQETTPEKSSEPQNPQNSNENDSDDVEEVEEEEEEIFDEDEIQMIDNMLGGCLIGGMNGLRGGSHDRRQNGFSSLNGGSMQFIDRNAIMRNEKQTPRDPDEFVIDTWTPVDVDGKPLCATDPLLIDLHTQHSLADKSIADCVEAILGAYLTTCKHRAAQLLLCYFGLKVLPRSFKPSGSLMYGYLEAPTNVLLDDSPAGLRKLELFTKDLASFEKKINYTFRNKAYLLQAFTHASYYLNTITDCYQRLEFLGDAILDFLITCRLFKDPRRHSPGALTDLRSALVNNTIFASLAVRHDFHKYFKAISPELHQIIDGFVRYQHLQEEAQGMDAQLAKRYYPTTEDTGIDDLADIVAPDAFMDQDDAEEEEEEDVEVPKALGDIFESVAGAIYVDSGMNLEEVWKVYSPMMRPLIEKFSSCVPRAPVRELLEMEPETAKFSWAEKRCDGKVRVTVEIIGKGTFKGVGRSYRIAKSAAARRALRFLKSQTD